MTTTSAPSLRLRPGITLSILATAWCLFLWAGRAWISETMELLYMPYNLGLACIPLLLSSIALLLPHRKRALIALALPWLLFLPNAPYLLTDLIHLKERPTAPLWFDWLFFVSFAMTGLLIGLTSLRQAHTLLERYLTPRQSWFAVVCILFLTAGGITLGRFMRWNSWDVVTSPGSLIADIIGLLLEPSSLPKLIAYTFGLAVLLTVGYIATNTRPQQWIDRQA